VSLEQSDVELAATLDSLDDAHNYRDWIFSLVRPFINGPVLEVGAGHGTFTELLAELGAVTAVEPSARAAGLLAERFAGDPRVAVVQGLLNDLPASPEFGAAVLINVLEHIPDDGAALDGLWQRLQPGGHLALWVPAFPLLYSRFDGMLGHHRRYRRRPLRALVEAHGFEVVDLRHVNSVGWFSWLIVARMLRQLPTKPRAVALYDRAVVPVLRAVETRVRPPFGQSLLFIARRPARG